MEIDERTDIFLTRPMKGEQPYLPSDATYLKKCVGGRIVTTAPTMVLGVTTGGRREELCVATSRWEDDFYGKPSCARWRIAARVG